MSNFLSANSTLLKIRELVAHKLDQNQCLTTGHNCPMSNLISELQLILHSHVDTSQSFESIRNVHTPMTTAGAESHSHDVNNNLAIPSAHNNANSTHTNDGDTTTTSRWTTLPTELLIKITDKLSLPDLKTLRLVASRFEPIIYRNLLQKDCVIHLKYISQKFIQYNSHDQQKSGLPLTKLTSTLCNAVDFPCSHFIFEGGNPSRHPDAYKLFQLHGESIKTLELRLDNPIDHGSFFDLLTGLAPRVEKLTVRDIDNVTSLLLPHLKSVSLETTPQSHVKSWRTDSRNMTVATLIGAARNLQHFDTGKEDRRDKQFESTFVTSIINKIHTCIVLVSRNGVQEKRMSWEELDSVIQVCRQRSNT